MSATTNKSLNKIVRATAGAGKTTGLLEAVYQSYQEFLQKEGRWPQILLSTFTVKAANELYERLVTKAVDLNDEHFLEYVSSSFLQVGTLHSVFSTILERVGEDTHQEGRVYSSKAQRKSIERGVLHQVIKERDLNALFFEARIEKDILELFGYMYENSNSESKTLTLKDLQQEVELELLDIISDIGDEKLIEALSGSGSKIPKLDVYLKDLNKKELKKYKRLVVFVNDEVNSLKFLERYESRHSSYKFLYESWKTELEKQLNQLQMKSLSDMEVQVLTSLEKHGVEERVWDFCFFDEYQDTSPIQKKILSLLAEKSQNYFVGDPFQSIYFFRGARKEIFLEEFRSIESLKGKTEYRLNNYRSAPEIVKFVNGLTKFVLPDFLEMEPSLVDKKGSVRVVHFEKGGLEDELHFISSEVNKIDLEKESVVILSRGAKELLECAKQLKADGVSHHLSLSKGFESSLEVIELIAFLKFLMDPNDDINLLILFMSTWCFVDDVAIKKALSLIKENQRLAKGCGRLENVEIHQQSVWSILNQEKGAQILLRLLNKTNEASPVYSRILTDFVSETGFLDFTDGMDSTGERERNIFKLIAALESEESKGKFSLKAFCEDILSGDYMFESAELKSERGCFLMTAHGSKGLQFDHVFILGTNKTNVIRTKNHYFNLETGLFGLKEYVESSSSYAFPLAIEKLLLEEKQEMKAESYRLFYVAMTRAKKSLFILGSKKLPKTTVAPSWFNLTLDYLSKTDNIGVDASVLEPNLVEEAMILNDPGHIADGVKPFHEELPVKGFLVNEEEAVYSDDQKILASRNLENTSINTVYRSSQKQKTFLEMSEAISEGVLFHELMERLSFNTEGDEVNGLETNEALSARDKKALNYLCDQKKFPFKDILGFGEKEWGFDFEGEVKISGKIDLWANVGGTVWVVDYKTGSLLGVEKGFAQLSVYKGILEKYLKNNDLVYKLVLTFPYHEESYIREG